MQLSHRLCIVSTLSILLAACNNTTFSAATAKSAKLASSNVMGPGSNGDSPNNMSNVNGTFVVGANSTGTFPAGTAFVPGNDGGREDDVPAGSPWRDALGNFVQPKLPVRDANGTITQVKLPIKDANGQILTGTLINRGTNAEGEGGDSSAGVTVPTDNVRITRTCSDSGSENSTNAKAAEAYGLSVKLIINHSVCTSSTAEMMKILRAGKLMKSDIQALCPSLVPASATKMAAKILVHGQISSKAENRNGSLGVLWARNSDGKETPEASDGYCDERSSPLIIHTASDPPNPQPINLSSQEDGIDFDLLGASNGHVPVRISWLTNDDYRFLALPDSRGSVHSIDQLFGNETTGPDGRTAANGYAALAKFDDNRDGIIDARDAVYSRLRLWSDKYRDGRSQRGELTSLKRAGIVFIDLDYSDAYSEFDEHGNETAMKSVVGLADGSLDLIFDLWFAY